LDKNDVENYSLSPLFDMVKKISQICLLNFFSTEIAVNTAGEFVVVDYVNESSDMRLQSVHKDGVPDEVVHQVVRRIADYISKRLSTSLSSSSV
jgi:hypothetical protein